MVKDTKQHLWDLSWGEAVCVREVLNNHYLSKLQPHDILNMGYAPENGNENLIKLVKEYIVETTGIEYKHILITNGTTAAINTVIRVLKGRSTALIHTVATKPICFPYYPEIIEKNQLRHLKNMYLTNMEKLGVLLLDDMPSNPLGSLDQSRFDYISTIWDSVYYNPVYINEPTIKVSAHRVNVGSFSKSFGLTGIRIGYIATNLERDFRGYVSDNLYENSAISTPSQVLMEDILSTVDRYWFFKQAKNSVNNNRESLNKIIHLFDGQKVPNNGMFYAANSTEKAISILDKAGVEYIILDNNGDKMVRFNLGQNNKITKMAVEAILKEDKI